MSPPQPSGAALAELLVALVLLAGLAVLSAPLAVRNGQLLLQGRYLLDGTDGALARAALLQSAGSGGCPSGAGRDSTRLAVVEWNARPAGGASSLELVIRDRTLRFPAETLATVIPCRP